MAFFGASIIGLCQRRVSGYHSQMVQAFHAQGRGCMACSGGGWALKTHASKCGEPSRGCDWASLECINCGHVKIRGESMH